MDKAKAEELANLINKEWPHSEYFRLEEERQVPLEEFNSWADGKDCVGAFLIRRTRDDVKHWFLLIDHQNKGEFYLCIIKENKQYVLEIHNHMKNEEHITWKYKPTKRDGKNSERRAIFKTLAGDLEQKILLPGERRTLDDFIEDIFALVYNREVAHDLKISLPEPTPKKDNMRQSLNNILYGPPGTGKTYATARRCVEICDGSAERSIETVRRLYRELVKSKRVEFITFHQSYGYEEFVEGLRPDTGPYGPTEGKRKKEGEIGPGFRLRPVPGVLRRIAKRARKKSPEAHVLVIDEINRANVSKVMGELVTLLEEDKREGEENEVAVTLPHSRKRFTLPPNLYILGTMNTADRSIALLDTALRRRFEFEELAPEPDVLVDILHEDKASKSINLPEVLRAMNRRLEWLIDRDHLIGHAWLMNARTQDDVDRVMRHKIIPLIAEYFYGDWGKVRAVLGGTRDFLEDERLDPPPGLEDTDTAESRQRWTVRKKFPEGAYNRLVAGSSAPTPDIDDSE